MRQVADLHTPNIVCAGSPAQDAVTRAELTLWRLNDTFKYLADDDDDRRICYGNGFLSECRSVPPIHLFGRRHLLIGSSRASQENGALVDVMMLFVSLASGLHNEV